MRPWRIGTRSGSRLSSCSVRILTGSGRSGPGSQRAWIERGARRRASLPVASCSLGLSVSGEATIGTPPLVGQGGVDLADRRAFGVAHALAAEPQKPLLAGLGDALGEPADELLVLLDLLVGRLRLQHCDRLPDVVEVVLLELVLGTRARVVRLGLRGDDLVEQLALAVLLARLRVGGRHREG